MRNKEVTEWRPWVIFICLLGMLAGAFVGRAVLSIFMILFFVTACFHTSFVQQVRRFASSLPLLFMSLLFFMPFISGLWSENKTEWLHVIRTKLPLLLMPLAFAGSWQLNSQQWKIIFYSFLLLFAVGCCWSFWQYFSHTSYINESYLRAKSIPTPFEDDHVRYSWMVAIAASAGILLFFEVTSAIWRLAVALLVLFFVVYLHVLAARTGLACFYFFVAAFIFYKVFLARQKKFAGMLLVVAMLPLIAWFALPTFQNRLKYILYDFSFARQQTYLPGGNDGNRIHSFKAGWQILLQKPFGVGAGDVRDASNQWYNLHIPNMLPADKLLPSSEWLVYGNAAGWFGVMVFTVAMLIPFFLKIKRYRFAWISLNATTALSFLFDIGLEVQFGVALYTFVVLCCYKWLCAEKSVAVE